MSSYQYRDSHVKDYENPLHLDVADRYLRRFQTRLRRVWNRFIPHESQVSIYHNQSVVGSLSRSPINTNKCVFQGWNTGTSSFPRLPQRRHPYKKVAQNCMRPYGDAVTVIVMRNKACHPLRLNPYRYIQKYQTHLYICRSTISLCHGFFVVCVYMHMYPD